MESKSDENKAKTKQTENLPEKKIVGKYWVIMDCDESSEEAITEISKAVLEAIYSKKEKYNIRLKIEQTLQVPELIEVA